MFRYCQNSPKQPRVLSTLTAHQSKTNRALKPQLTHSLTISPAFRIWKEAQKWELLPPMSSDWCQGAPESRISRFPVMAVNGLHNMKATNTGVKFIWEGKGNYEWWGCFQNWIWGDVLFLMKLLQVLNLQGCWMIKDSGLVMLSNGSTSRTLKELIISERCELDRFWGLVFEANESLEELDLSLLNVSDVSLIAIAEHC